MQPFAAGGSAGKTEWSYHLGAERSAGGDRSALVPQRPPQLSWTGETRHRRIRRPLSLVAAAFYTLSAKMGKFFCGFRPLFRLCPPATRIRLRSTSQEAAKPPPEDRGLRQSLMRPTRTGPTLTETPGGRGASGFVCRAWNLRAAETLARFNHLAGQDMRRLIWSLVAVLTLCVLAMLLTLPTPDKFG